MNSDIRLLYDRLVPQVLEGLQRRNIGATFVETRKEALETILARMNCPATVLTGGSETVRQLGLIPAIQATPGLRYLNPEIREIHDATERYNFRRWAGTANYYIAGINALVIDGRIVNIDGGGSRMSAYAFSAGQVIMVTGVNKICKTLDEAMYRTREWASVLTAIKSSRGRRAPCVDDGICHEEICVPPDRECGKWLIIEKETMADRIHVVLIGEELGY